MPACTVARCKLLKGRSRPSRLEVVDGVCGFCCAAVNASLACFALLFVLVIINFFVDIRILDIILGAVEDQHLRHS